MTTTISLDKSARADDPAADKTRGDDTHEVLPDLAYQRLSIVNIVYYGMPGAGDGNWVLIDAGIPGTTQYILRAVEKRFGPNARPYAIIMTHGHFDHVGTLEELVQRWQVPVYAHSLELPYLNGTAAYPPADPTVGGGLMSLLSPLYPRDPVDVAPLLHMLPPDGHVPGMPGWQWIHVPGHTPGQVALWRESDRTLITADAFITTKQESAYSALFQDAEMHGPPAYYTQNWDDARTSVQKLAALEPEIVVTGHGRAMQGPEMRTALHQLAQNFDALAVPKQGRYVEHPTSASDASAYTKPSH